MNIELLQQLCEASAVSGDEQEVRDILINTLEPCVNEITFDGLGSFVARKGNKGPKVAVVGHMDEVGFMVTHIDESGFLRFTTIGGWWNQSMLNHRVTIRTHKGVKIPGVIGSVAPHALTEKQRQQPLSFDEMFIDIGANSRDEVEKRGVAMGDFISPEANFACWGEDKVVGKALDNRIGCAMMAELLQTVNNPEITLYGVGSVEEEVPMTREDLAANVFNESEEMQNTFISASLEHELPKEVEVPKQYVTKKLKNQKIKTDTGIELSFPTEYSENSNFIEFVNHQDGTITIEIKNIGKITNKA